MTNSEPNKNDLIESNRLLRQLAPTLTAAEEKLRTLELEQQASKYFGGLSTQERDALGLKLDEEDCDVLAVDEPVVGRTFVDWVWAVVYILIFCWMIYWVLAVK